MDSIPLTFISYFLNNSIEKKNIFQVVAPDEQYKVNRSIDEASISVSGMTETNKITVTITLTSPIMREQILCSGKDTLSTASSDILGGKKTSSNQKRLRPSNVIRTSGALTDHNSR